MVSTREIRKRIDVERAKERRELERRSLKKELRTLRTRKIRSFGRGVARVGSKTARFLGKTARFGGKAIVGTGKFIKDVDRLAATNRREMEKSQRFKKKRFDGREVRKDLRTRGFDLIP